LDLLKTLFHLNFVVFPHHIIFLEIMMTVRTAKCPPNAWQCTSFIVVKRTLFLAIMYLTMSMNLISLDFPSPKSQKKRGRKKYIIHVQKM